MSGAVCDRCTKSVGADALIPHAGKRICLECEMELEDTKRMRGSVYRSVASVPIIVVVTFLSLCIPYLSVVLFPLLTVATIVVAIQAIRLALSIRQDPEEYGVTEAIPIVLLIEGIVACVIGAGYAFASLLMLLGMVALLAGS